MGVSRSEPAGVKGSSAQSAPQAVVSTVPPRSSVITPPSGPSVVPKEIQRFIGQRSEVLVDAAREAALNGQRRH